MSTQQIEPETVGFRTSPQQQHLLAVGGGALITRCAASVDASLHEGAVRRFLEQAVARHEILRTTFAQTAGMRTRQQIIHEDLPPAWSVENASATTLLSDSAALSALLEREGRGGFDLERGPLLRGRFIGIPGERGLLVLSAAAVCADAHSLLVLLEELGIDGTGTDEPIQYADYAQWRHELASEQEPESERAREFWDELAADPQPPRLMFGSLSPRGTGELARVAIEIGDAADAPSGAELPLFLEAAWHALIARMTGAREIVIAGELDGRSQPDLDRAIGGYSQAAPVRSRVEEATSFAEILDQVRRGRDAAARWQDYASGAELEALSHKTGVGFSFQAIDPAGRPTEVLALGPALPGLPLVLAARGGAAGPEAELQYDPGAFGRSDAEEIAQRFATLVVSAAADQAAPVASLALIDAHERASLIAGAAGPDPAGVESAARRSVEEQSRIPVHVLFEQHAELTPDGLAVEDHAGRMTYRELNEAANRLAHLLRGAGAGPGVPVGLCMERSASMLVAVLGILKAGSAYLPLNFEHPQARIAHQLGEAQAPILVTEEQLAGRLPPFDGSIIDPGQSAECPASNPESRAQLDDLAYVMYTSGSTGVPKGVAVSHGNLANYCAYMVARLSADQPTGDAMRFGVVSAISTDLGNTAIFPALAAGAAVRLIPAEASMDGESLVTELSGRPLDVLKITPSHLRALLGGGPAVLPRQWLILGGEALAWELVEQIRRLSPRCRIMNHYGPTETTIGCCTYDVDAERRRDSLTVPIGSALMASSAYVLDRRLEPVPVGVPGELCVSGAGVAAGYVGGADPSQQFTWDPFAGGGQARMYRTGDRVRYLRDGAIEFLGRVDDQVKIRGFRVEPQEIEAALARHPAIRQAAVSAEEDRGQLRLVAYLVAPEAPSVEELHALLSETLPDYMIPSRFANVEAMPFTPSGKVDRRALPGLAATQMRREADFVAPRDEVEAEIAEIWRELLGVQRVGVFDDFFALGGHSLLATQAIMRIRRLHGEVPLRALLAAPTIAALAEAVRGTGASGAGERDGGP